MNTYFATYEGQTVTENSSREYNYASVVYIPWKNEIVVGFTWSKSEKGARTGGLTPHQRKEGMKVVAVVPVSTEAPAEEAPATEEAPVAVPCKCLYLDCDECCPEYIPAVGDKVRDTFGNIFEVVMLSGKNGLIELRHTVHHPYASVPKTPTGAFGGGYWEKVPEVTETVVKVDVVSENLALVHLSDRDGGQLHREDGRWLVEDTYGSGRTIGKSPELDDAGEILARHRGVEGALRVAVAYDF